MSALLAFAAAAFAVATWLYLTRLVHYQVAPPVAGRAVFAVALGVLVGAVALGLTEPETGLRAGPLAVLIVVGLLAVVAATLERVGDWPLAGPVMAPIAAVVSLAMYLKLVVVEPVVPEVGLRVVTIVHISATITGVLLFVPSFVLSILFLGQSYRLKTKQLGRSRLPSLVTMERTAWRLLYVGFPLFTLGIVLGAVWQESAHSGVRPGQVFAAISWSVYAFAIYRRISAGWRGVRAAVTLIAAFVVTLGAVLSYMLR